MLEIENLMDRKNLWDLQRNPFWAVLLLMVLAWQSYQTATYLHPHYLLFVCYAANLLLGIGIIIRSHLLVAVGAVWTLFGFPFWLIYNIQTSQWAPGSLLLHVGGAFIAVLAVKDYDFPRTTWAASLSLGLVMRILARTFTLPSLNINAAFRVYDGWEWLFSDYTVYSITLLLGCVFFFMGVTQINIRVRRRKEKVKIKNEKRKIINEKK